MAGVQCEAGAIALSVQDTDSDRLLDESEATAMLAAIGYDGAAAEAVACLNAAFRGWGTAPAGERAVKWVEFKSLWSPAARAPIAVGETVI